MRGSQHSGFYPSTYIMQCIACLWHLFLPEMMHNWALSKTNGVFGTYAVFGGKDEVKSKGISQH